jgi:hypothetical protein
MVAVTRDEEETSENRGASSTERLVAPCSGSGFRTNILACCGQVHVLPLRTPGDDYWPFVGKSRSWAARAARLPSWAFQSSIHGSDQKVRAPTAVNKRACRRLGTRVGFRSFRYGGVADFQEPTMSLNMLWLAVQVPNLVCQPLPSAANSSTPPRLL